MTRRWPPLILIAALLVAGIVVGRDGVVVDADEALPDPSTLVPVAAPDDALGSLWFCAGQTAGDDTLADGTLVIANPSDEPAAGQVTVVSDAGDRAAEDLEVAPWRTVRLRVADLLEADWAAAQVETTSGTVVVEHEVVGPLGRAVAACQTRTSGRLRLPAGATTRDARLTLLVYNPSADAATVDLSFVTDEGVRRPSDLQGLPVPTGSVVPIDVSPVVTVRPVLATVVSARRGGVVVDRIQTFGGRGAATTEEEVAAQRFRRKGLTVTPAVPTAVLSWSFPAGLRAEGIHEQVTVFNPADEAAEVEVSLALEDPQRNGEVDPFPLEVPAQATRVLDVDLADGVPDGISHSLEVRSTNGVPVVAERSLSATEGTIYRAELASTGSPVASSRWVFAAGLRSADAEAERIALVNPGDEAVDVTLVAFGDGERSAPLGDEPVTLAPGEHRELDIGQLGGVADGQTSIEVEASGPIAAERRLISRPADPDDEESEPGVGGSTALGIPLGPDITTLG